MIRFEYTAQISSTFSVLTLKILLKLSDEELSEKVKVLVEEYDKDFRAYLSFQLTVLKQQRKRN